MVLKIIKSVVAFLGNIFNLIKALAYIIIFSKFNPEISKYYRENNEECIILGNGPSLKETLAENFDFLENKKKLCVNDFANSPLFMKIKPDYYIFTDPAYWSDNISLKFKTAFNKYYNILKNDVSWPIILFFPVASKKNNFFHDLAKKNSNITICYINTTEINCFKSLRFYLYRKNLAIPPMQNVLVATIFVCLNLGFKKIFLTGADHSWHESFYVSENNILYLKNSRFQDKGIMILSPFFEDPAEKKPFKMHNLLFALARMFKGYMELEEYSKYLGAKIYNASNKSYIDAFERYKIK